MTRDAAQLTYSLRECPCDVPFCRFCLFFIFALFCISDVLSKMSVHPAETREGVVTSWIPLPHIPRRLRVQHCAGADKSAPFVLYAYDMWYIPTVGRTVSKYSHAS